MTEPRLHYLYRQYINDLSSPAELLELETLLKDQDKGLMLSRLLDNTWDELSMNNTTDLSEDKADQIYTTIVQNEPGAKKEYKTWAIRIAASILLFLSIGLILYQTSTPEPAEKIAARPAAPAILDVPPGGNKAVLTLANGRDVILDDAQTGEIASQEGVSISKVKDGQLIYASGTTDLKNTTTGKGLNTLTIPKGGQYQLSLPDGTRVYLNSASSLAYPTHFSGRERKVILTGEAYFEVAKNPGKPFIIDVNHKQQIQVLGTHFNVEAYTDEQVINTTLLEGSVKILCNNKQTLLKPGQVAVNRIGRNLELKPADLEEIMAWKNGLFIFNNENITDVMKKISRWYNVEVVFRGNMENVNFLGNYSRAKSLASLLKNIELMEKVNIAIEGRRITVTRLYFGYPQ